jgi:hypothetical protein
MNKRVREIQIKTSISTNYLPKTDYVPVKTIITVRTLAVTVFVRTYTSVDIPGLRKR